MRLPWQKPEVKLITEDDLRLLIGQPNNATTIGSLRKNFLLGKKPVISGCARDGILVELNVLQTDDKGKPIAFVHVEA